MCFCDIKCLKICNLSFILLLKIFFWINVLRLFNYINILSETCSWLDNQASNWKSSHNITICYLLISVINCSSPSLLSLSWVCKYLFTNVQIVWWTAIKISVSIGQKLYLQWMLFFLLLNYRILKHQLWWCDHFLEQTCWNILNSFWR